MLDSGDTFSFNDVVGPRTKKYGYRRAINGRGAKVLGGGVAQVASALWLAIEDCDDIRVIEKSTYGKHYNQRYVSDAADAILTDYASGRDFRFRYTGDSSLTIYAYVDDGWLYCEVYEG
jgi:vancomycin resistance protein VanW